MSTWAQSLQSIFKLFHGSAGGGLGAGLGVGLGVGPAPPSGQGASRFWSGATMDDLLRKQDWSKLMEHLYSVLDRRRCREAADWIKVHAEEGHVALLYIYLRNGVKYIGRRVLRTQEFTYWVKVWVYLVFRCVEDALTCSKVMGLKKTNEALALIQKTLGWLAAYEGFAEWPSPAAVLADMHVPDRPFASPAWIPGFEVAKVGHSVYFDTGTQDVMRACAHNEGHFSATQAEIRAELLKELEVVDTWEAFMRAVHRRLLDV